MLLLPLDQMMVTGLFVKFEGKNLNDDKYVGSWYMASGLQGGAKFATITDPRTWSIGFGTTF